MRSIGRREIWHTRKKGNTIVAYPRATIPSFCLTEPHFQHAKVSCHSQLPSCWDVLEKECET